MLFTSTMDSVSQIVKLIYQQKSYMSYMSYVLFIRCTDELAAQFRRQFYNRKAEGKAKTEADYLKQLLEQDKTVNF